MFSSTTGRRTLFKMSRVAQSAWIAAGLAVWLSVLGGPGLLGAQEAEPRKDAPAPIRITLTKSSFSGVNRNDALAAIAAWAKVILKQRGIDAEVETSIAERWEELAEELRSGQTDAASMLTEELLELKAKPDFVFVSSKNNSFTERYVILVHRNSGIADVGDLRGRKLLLLGTQRTSLAPAWLAGLMAGRSMGLPEKVLASMTRIDNASRTILPVFFRQADACVVTSNVFEIASELNPQVRKELRVLTASPEVVPAVFFFRPGYSTDVKDKLESALLDLHETPAGQQVLMIFQGDRLVKQPISCLEGSRQVLEEGGRFSRRRGT